MPQAPPEHEHPTPAEKALQAHARSQIEQAEKSDRLSADVERGRAKRAGRPDGRKS